MILSRTLARLSLRYGTAFRKAICPSNGTAEYVFETIIRSNKVADISGRVFVRADV